MLRLNAAASNPPPIANAPKWDALSQTFQTFIRATSGPLKEDSQQTPVTQPSTPNHATTEGKNGRNRFTPEAGLCKSGFFIILHQCKAQTVFWG